MVETWKRIDGKNVTGLNENGERYTRPATKHELKYLRQWETGKSKADEEAAMERALRGEES